MKKKTEYSPLTRRLLIYRYIYDRTMNGGTASMADLQAVLNRKKIDDKVADKPSEETIRRDIRAIRKSLEEANLTAYGLPDRLIYKRGGEGKLKGYIFEGNLFVDESEDEPEEE